MVNSETFSDNKITVCPFFGIPPLTVLYGKRHFEIGDTSPIVYSDCKLSVSLSDGMSGVYGDKVFPTVRGDIVVFNPDEIHFGRVTEPGIHRYLDIYFPKDFFRVLGIRGEKLGGLFFDEPTQRMQYIVPAKERSEVITLAEQLALWTESDPAEHELELFCGAVKLLLLTAQLAERQKETPPVERLPRVVRKTVRYIDEHFAEPLSLSVFAEHAGCSITYLTKTFRQATGKTVHAYLTERRLHEAQKMLSSQVGITEVAFACGFTDCSSFIKIFRRYFGCTPAGYRKNKVNNTLDNTIR